MAASSTYELKFKSPGGYDVIIRGVNVGFIYPLERGGWLILRDATHHAWETKEDAAEELLRQFEDMKAGG